MKDSEAHSPPKTQPISMSYRQQLKYVMEKSKETTSIEPRSISDEQLSELIEYIQDESIRVSSI